MTVGSGDRALPVIVLLYWEQRYGKLDANLRRRFLRRDELRIICKYSEATVFKCIDRHHRLADVVRCLGHQPDPIRKIIKHDPDSRPSPKRPKIPPSEAAIGERCSQCDAWVPSGVIHDC